MVRYLTIKLNLHRPFGGRTHGSRPYNILFCEEFILFQAISIPIITSHSLLVTRYLGHYYAILFLLKRNIDVLRIPVYERVIDKHRRTRRGRTRSYYSGMGRRRTRWRP